MSGSSGVFCLLWTKVQLLALPNHVGERALATVTVGGCLRCHLRWDQAKMLLALGPGLAAAQKCGARLRKLARVCRGS